MTLVLSEGGVPVWQLTHVPRRYWIGFVCFIACNIDDRWHIFLWCVGDNSIVFNVCCDIAEFETDAFPQLSLSSQAW
jgi:hypothetical protein